MATTSRHHASDDRHSGRHRGVDRIAGILEAAAASPTGLRLTDAASLLDAPPSSIHSLIKGLTAVGYLEEFDGRYVIGRGLQALLAPHQASWLVDLCHGEISKLSREAGETTLLGVEAGDSIVYIFQAEGTQSIHYTAKTGGRRPIYPTSMGKLFLAAKGDRALSAFFRSHTKLDRARVTAELEQVRRDGVAFNRQETVKGVIAAASPIHSSDGATIIAAVSVVGPVYRLEDELDAIATSVAAAAAKLTKLVRNSPLAQDAIRR